MAKVYNCVVNHSKENWITYRSVNHLGKFVKFLDSKYGEHTNQRWNFFNVFDAEAYKAKNKKKQEPLISYQNGKNRNVPTSKYI